MNTSDKSVCFIYILCFYYKLLIKTFFSDRVIVDFLPLFGLNLNSLNDQNVLSKTEKNELIMLNAISKRQM